MNVASLMQASVPQLVATLLFALFFSLGFHGSFALLVFPSFRIVFPCLNLICC